MLNRAKEICDNNNIKPKKISLKLLCPLLDYAGLEEDEYLRENWAFLLSNMVDSDQNIQNHVFPYLLSQISKSEFNELQKTFFLKTERIITLNEELKIHLENKPLLEKSILAEISKVDIKDYSNKWKLESKLKELSDNERILKSRMNESEQLSQTNLQEYEISNLSRLGVIKGIPIHNVYSEPIRVKGKNSQYYSHEIDEDQTIDLDISVEADGENFILTELGELFIKACTEKIN
jgi:hypothetical protein